MQSDTPVFKIKVERNKYRIKVECDAGPLYCHVYGEVALFNIDDLSGGRPEIKHIGWSCGGTRLNTDGARAFFRAGILVMNRLDKELAKAKSKAAERSGGAG